MKKLLSIAIVLFVGFQAHSQYNNGRVKFEDLRKKVIFKLSPFHFIDKTLNVQTEIFTDAQYKNSFQISLNGMYQSNRTVSDIGGSIELQGRYYPRSFKPDTMPWVWNKVAGLYFGYGAQLGANEYWKSSYEPVYDAFKNYVGDVEGKRTWNSQWVTPFFCFGYQLIVWETLYIDVYLGGGIKINSVTRKFENIQNNDLNNDNPVIFDRYYKGIIPKMGFSIGIGL